ncbi:MAG: peptidoglycan-binding protein [Clostridia bacterium]|nr:peptidoglycan-binding protein [Clostridia bacterium]
MKELFKKTAANSGRTEKGSPSGPEQNGTENETSSSKKLKESSTPASYGHENFIKKFFRGMVKYRFAISCAAVVLLTAIVIGAMFGGRNSAIVSNDPDNTQIIAENNTPEPAATEPAEETVPPTAPATVPPADPNETIPPIVTQEPYEPVETPVPYHTPLIFEVRDDTIAKYGFHDKIIPSVQERLMVLCYMDQDEPTDYFGRVTKGALEAFQRRSDLPVTGELDRTTYYKLFDVNAKVYLCSVGDEGTDVQAIEERLYELGYLDEANEVFDEATRDAVVDFQQRNDLDADGKVGRNTKEALYNPECVAKAWAFGDTGEKVLTYQNRLRELGYLTTEPDGVYGKDTQMAVRRFQMQNQLIEDGYLGPSTIEKLMSDDAVGNALSISMQGSDVLNVQTRLHELNYMKASDVNGYFTSLTEKAVKLFQKNNNLQQDGKVGRNTMRVLMSDEAIKAAAPVTNTPPSSGGGNNGGGNNGGGNSGGGNNGGGNNGGGGGGGNNGGGNSGGSDVQSKINNFISVARSKLGCKYVRGGKGPNVFDCSGFVYWVLNHSGVSQGYMTSYMWRSCTRYQRNNSIYNVKKGDVIVYYGHVAICSGTWTMIDASSSKGKVVERSFNGNYWYRNFICSFRIFR